MKNDTPYDTDFFSSLRHRVESSARVIVPILYDTVRPGSVVDVGCGEGVWLAEFQRCGVQEILGIDGDWVDRQRLEIPHDCYQAQDLRLPVHLGRQFDLALSLECAEHLPEESADNIVDTLVQVAPVVAFSAAIPGQGGRDHINEQWPQYWSDKFQSRNYIPADCIRPLIWKNRMVAWYYAQNLVLYVNASYKRKVLAPPNQFEEGDDNMLNVVHPDHYAGLLWTSQIQDQLIEVAGLLPRHSRIIFVDGTTHRIYGKRENLYIIPFRDPLNYYSGWPENDDAAIQLLLRLQRGGARYIVFPVQTRWILDHYRGLRAYLDTSGEIIDEGSDLVVYRLNDAV